jgi:hypothetical protein
MITSAILLGVAVVAYILFYFNYVPQIGVERIIHLQYGYVVTSSLRMWRNADGWNIVEMDHIPTA